MKTEEAKLVQESYTWLLAFMPLDKRCTIVGQRLLANLRTHGAKLCEQDEQEFEADCNKTANILKMP